MRLARLSISTAIVASALAAPASAQIPDSFTNLKLLDSDIDKQQLVAIMRDWAGAMGVRCNHCHVGPDDLQGMDFASDEKATKRTARQMLIMARAINRELLADLPTVEEGESRQAVSCFTCHRGQPKPPRDLRKLVVSTATQQGVDAALEEYEALRREHYGRGHYDFSSRAVAAVAQRLMELERPHEAVPVLERGLRYDPEAPDLHARLGMALAESGELERARAAFARALELEPENRLAQIGQRRVEAALRQP